MAQIDNNMQPHERASKLQYDHQKNKIDAAFPCERIYSKTASINTELRTP